MGIYNVEVLSTVKTAIPRRRFPKGDSHIVPGHETRGCIEEYHNILSNLRPIGTWHRYIYITGSRSAENDR